MTKAVTLFSLSEQISELNEKISILAQVSLLNKNNYNVNEAAIYTNLSPSYLYKLTCNKQIPHYKPRGKQIYFSRAELDDWLQQNRVTTTGEIEAAAANHIAGIR